MTTNADSGKDRSQQTQRKMLADHFRRLARSPETGEKAVYTFVPGNLTELLLSFDLHRAPGRYRSCRVPMDEPACQSGAHG